MQHFYHVKRLVRQYKQAKKEPKIQHEGAVVDERSSRPTWKNFKNNNSFHSFSFLKDHSQWHCHFSTKDLYIPILTEMPDDSRDS